jgi:hypothetical protein
MSNYFTPAGQQVAFNALDPDTQALMARYPQAPAAPELIMPGRSTVPGLDPSYVPPIQPQAPATMAPAADTGAQYLPAYSAPKPTVSPVDMQRASTLAAFGQMGLEVDKSYDEAQKSQIAAMKAQADADRVAAEQQKKIGLEEQKNYDVEMQRQKDEASHVAETVKTATDLENQWRNSTVDPKRWWSSKDMGEKAQSVIAVMLGNMGSALAGGDGAFGSKMIDRLIDQDIQMQQGERNQKEGVAKQAWRQVDDRRQVFQSETAQIAAANLHRINALEKIAAPIIANAKSAAVQKNGQALLADLNVKRQKALADIGTTAIKEANDMYQNAYAATGGFTRPVGGDPKAKTNYGYATDVTAAEKVRAAEASKETLKTAVQRARDTITEFGTWSPGGVGAARIADAERTIFKAFQSAFDSGVLNKDEAERYKEMSGLSLWNSNTFAQEQLNLLEKEAENNFDKVMKAHIMPENRVQQGYKRAPSER